MNATLASSDDTLRAAREILRDSLRQAYREDTDLSVSQFDVICALGAVIGELSRRFRESTCTRCGLELTYPYQCSECGHLVARSVS